jgi:hypothetical protein
MFEKRNIKKTFLILHIIKSLNNSKKEIINLVRKFNYVNLGWMNKKLEFFLNIISDYIFEYENFQRIISSKTQSLGQFSWQSFEAEKNLIIS